MKLRSLLPDETAISAYEIDYEAEYARGVRGLIFDIDNTLVPQDAPATEAIRPFFEKLHRIGFETCILSNNREARVKAFADVAGSRYHFLAKKPKPDGFLAAMALLHTGRENTLAIGDQIFTDVLGARRAGIRTVLVQPIDLRSDLFGIRIRRIFEKIVLSAGDRKEKALEKRMQLK